MNYLSHGRHLLDDPWTLAGTALPDWTRILDRRNRFRLHTLPGVDDETDERVQKLIRGIHAHFADDDWFHIHPAFISLMASTTARIRARTEGLRASVLSHILVEMLLDAELLRRVPDATERYYDALMRVDVDVLSVVVDRLLPKPSARLPELVQYFLTHRWLDDYASDEGTFLRLDGLSRRISLGALPQSEFLDVIRETRAEVREGADPLLR